MRKTGSSAIAQRARAIRVWALLAFGIALGAAVGSVTVGNPPVYADGGSFCEQDECETHRVWYTFFIKKVWSCVDNAPHNTGCNMVGKKCYTYGCGGPTGPTGGSGGGGSGGGGGGGGGCDAEDEQTGIC